jgi:hypothetical protein
MMRVSRESDKHPKDQILHASQERKDLQNFNIIVYLIITVVSNRITGRVCLFVVCFPGVTTNYGCIFHSPVAGFSLLVFEVS